jgi:hypothetical protein
VWIGVKMASNVQEKIVSRLWVAPYINGRFCASRVQIYGKKYIVLSSSSDTLGLNVWLNAPLARWGEWRGNVVVVQEKEVGVLTDVEVGSDVLDIIRALIYYGNFNSMRLSTGGFCEEWRDVLYLAS